MSFKNKQLSGFFGLFRLQSAMMTFQGECKMHGNSSRIIAGRLPTLKKPNGRHDKSGFGG